jgi:hypothetical protein
VGGPVSRGDSSVKSLSFTRSAWSGGDDNYYFQDYQNDQNDASFISRSQVYCIAYCPSGKFDLAQANHHMRQSSHSAMHSVLTPEQ